MRRPDHVGVGFTDLLFNALLGFVVMFILAFLLINPIAKSGAVGPEGRIPDQARGPDGREEDLDLYVEDPEGDLVWFRSREAGLMHLDRDDLGNRNDTIVVGGRPVINALNQEIVSIRGIVPGEYVVNLHLYRGGGDQPVPATVKIEKLNPKVELVFFGPLTLTAAGEEQTAARFSIGADGRVRDVNRLPKQLVPLRRIAAGPTGEPS